MWRPEDQVLQFLAFPDIKVAVEKQVESFGTRSIFLYKFDIGFHVGRRSQEERMRKPLTIADAEAIAEAAMEECERFYPVFQFVLWGGKSPVEAISAALIDTHGEA